MKEMRKRISINVGDVFERLTVMESADCINGESAWVCMCNCGARKIIKARNLVTKISRSCGCLRTEASKIRNRVHGEALKTKEYSVWSGMKSRCINPNGKSYRRYGGRGVTVCDRWRYSYKNFLEDMGRAPSPKHSIDRIDNNGNYEPGNCRWATSLEQARNRPYGRKIKIV